MCLTASPQWVKLSRWMKWQPHSRATSMAHIIRKNAPPSDSVSFRRSFTRVHARHISPPRHTSNAASGSTFKRPAMNITLPMLTKVKPMDSSGAILRLKYRM